jgi:hypothetical protein
LDSADSIVFLINSNTIKESTISLNGQRFRVPQWTALVLQKGVEGLLNEVFSSSSIAPHPEIRDYRDPSSSSAILQVSSNAIKWIQEPVGIWDASRSHIFERPTEQIRLTYDETDYLWYERNNISISFETDQTVTISIEPPTDLVYVYINGRIAHTDEIAVMNVNMDQNGEKHHKNATKGKFGLFKHSYYSCIEILTFFF